MTDFEIIKKIKETKKTMFKSFTSGLKAIEEQLENGENPSMTFIQRFVNSNRTLYLSTIYEIYESIIEEYSNFSEEAGKEKAFEIFAFADLYEDLTEAIEYHDFSGNNLLKEEIKNEIEELQTFHSANLRLVLGCDADREEFYRAGYDFVEALYMRYQYLVERYDRELVNEIFREKGFYDVMIGYQMEQDPIMRSKPR